MTTDDGPAFFAIFERVQRIHGKPKDGAMALEYFEALKGLSLHIVDTAAKQVVKTSRFFPKPVDWLEAAYTLEKPKPGFAKERWATTASGETVPTFVCLKCNDTGWRLECGCEFESVYGKCDQHGTGSSASRMPVLPCHCRDTNPVWLEAHNTIRPFQVQR
jgi:hypothetical protein